jgi:hypothetical protein
MPRECRRPVSPRCFSVGVSGYAPTMNGCPGMKNGAQARAGARRSDPLLDEAARLGFALVDYVTPSGQTVWEWRCGDGPRPQFVTERVARQWMSEWIDRVDMEARRPA